MIESMHDSPAAVRTLDLHIWEWLLALLAAGLVVFVLPIPKIVALALVFGAALIKAVLVVRNYMHLKAEHPLLYVIALFPVLLFIVMAIALLPDIAWKR